MNSTIFSSLNLSVQYGDLITYLKYSGWQLIEDMTSRYIIFMGPKDVENNPIEIVFLKNFSAHEQSLYISNALEILLALQDTEPWNLALDIKNINRDNLRVRILDEKSGDNISLKNAANQIYQLKQLVTYAACSEKDQKPFYINSQKHPFTNHLVEEFRFGHTFKGSFGLSIETPRFMEINNYKQLSLLPEIVGNRYTYPYWRKVMERIVRGLSHIQEATEQRNSQLIIENYKTGLNANMCQALGKMIKFSKKSQNLEYSIKWAALKLPDDPIIQHTGPIQLSESDYDHLEFAANKLMELPSEDIMINGLVIELSAKESPLSLDTSRVVRIRWNEEAEGKEYEATATLNVEDYTIAIQAHKNWNLVQIKGTLSKRKQNWHFINYSQFKIIN